jgi:hypothetical protein
VGLRPAVDIYVGTTLTATTADVSRPDVQAAFGLPGAAHGFDVTVPIPAGQGRVCVYAMDAQDVGRSGLACPTFGNDARGHLDAWSMSDATHAHLVGWTYDPDNAGGPGSIVVTVGPASYPFTAMDPRPDVAQAFNLPNPNEGFAVDVPLAPGTQTVCVIGKNTAGAGADLRLGCHAFTAR